MSVTNAPVGRGMVIAGFALMAVGALITLTRLLIGDYLFDSQSLVGTAESIVSPLAAVVAVWAWWWLTSFIATGPTQIRAMRRGLYGLSLQYVLIFTVSGAVIVSTTTAPAATFFNMVQWWAQSIGALVISVGFFTTSRSLRDRSTLEPVVATVEVDPSDGTGSVL